MTGASHTCALPICGYEQLQSVPQQEKEGRAITSEPAFVSEELMLLISQYFLLSANAGSAKHNPWLHGVCFQLRQCILSAGGVACCRLLPLTLSVMLPYFDRARTCILAVQASKSPSVCCFRTAGKCICASLGYNRRQHPARYPSQRHEGKILSLEQLYFHKALDTTSGTADRRDQVSHAHLCLQYGKGHSGCDPQLESLLPYLLTAM